MKFKEIKELVKLFNEDKYDSYELIFWDYARQKRMDGHFGSLSHPGKEITIPINVVGEDFWPTIRVDGLAEVVPSPFVEGANAYLKKQDDYEMSGVKFTRYFYECEATQKQFGTTASETFTMCEFYCAEVKRLREENKKLREDKTIKGVWEKVQNGRVD